MKLLLVKTSSMGDLIHTLPAITDATNAIPGLEIDWVAEESFADVPTWHDSINDIIIIPYRYWKKNLFRKFLFNKIRKVCKQIRKQRYDIVLDAQSNLKSAVITRIARGKRYGVDMKSVAEKGANFSYQKIFKVDRAQHAVDRMRQIFSLALDYELPKTAPDYAINTARLPKAKMDLPEKYILLTHNTSRIHKLWPEQHWLKLIELINMTDYAVVLPWGSEEEHQRAEEFARHANHGIVMPPMDLTTKISVIANAAAAVSLDTGIGHLTAALNIPNINLYGPTDPKYIGAMGQNQVHLTAEFECAPCNRSQCYYKKEVDLFPACMATLTPEYVFKILCRALEGKSAACK